MPKTSRRCQEQKPIRQACAIPYRWHNGELEFCLITASRKRRWGFPKGVIDPGESAKQTALKEAWEEAGLTGRIEGKALGQYTYQKWGCDLVVSAYLMHVAAAADQWMESGVRQRRWASAAQAAAKLHRKEQLLLLENAVARLTADRRLPEAHHPVETEPVEAPSRLRP